MDDISLYDINLEPYYVSTHKEYLNSFFKKYRDTLSSTSQVYKTKSYNHFLAQNKYSMYGSYLQNLQTLKPIEIQRIQLVERSYFGFPYFLKKNRYLTHRGPVYYITGLVDQKSIKFIRTFSMLDTSLGLLEILATDGLETNSYSTMCLLDEIRYKFIILYEFIMMNNNDSLIPVFETIAKQAMCLFYSYIEPEFLNPSQLNLQKFINLAKESLLAAAQILDTSEMNMHELRPYKEGDNPFLVTALIKKLKASIADKNIDLIIGIRFGGIELPYLIQSYIYPHAYVNLVKISIYSNENTAISISPLNIKNNNILIIDDNILTGRTLSTLVDYLKKYYARNIYFSCISYSGMKRYSQMIMPEHGVVNPLVLEKSCILDESEYTHITSSLSYKNKNGVFDKVKKRIQSSVNRTNFDFKL